MKTRTKSVLSHSLSLPLLAAVALVLLSALAACSGGDDAENAQASPDSDASTSVQGESDASGDDALATDDGAVDGGNDDDADDPVITKDGGGGFPGAYASPTIVRDGTTFHAYFAAHTINGKHYNAPHGSFTADGTWTFLGEALPHLGKQADEGPGKYPVWAPAAAQIDATHWVLYYTAHLVGTTGKKCIWRAHASSPDGPFVDDYAGPIECEPATLWAIDPYLVQDAQKRWHLAARLDEPGGINTIQIRELNAQATAYAAGSSWVKLTQNAPTSWEQPVLENAGIVRLAPPVGDPHWFVFYSARAWSDDRYAIGYADCGTGINGPCVKKTPTGPWMATDASAKVFGPGTPTFYSSGTGDTLMSVQAWEFSGGTSNKKNNGQIMRTYKMTIDNAYAPTATLTRVDK